LASARDIPIDATSASGTPARTLHGPCPGWQVGAGPRQRLRLALVSELKYGSFTPHPLVSTGRHRIVVGPGGFRVNDVRPD
jgi:hypothetical protein